MELSLAEILLVAVVAAVFIGPKELPVVVRAAARAMRAVRSLYAEMRKAWDALARESGLEETAGAVNQDLRLIKGDDGKFYESYDLPPLAPGAKRGE